MNHRYFSRTLIRLAVKLRSGQAEIGHYITRDLNHGGIGIEGTFRQIKLSAIIEVEFIDHNLDFHNKIKGLLVQHTDNSIGLMFTKDYDVEIDYILNNFRKEGVLT